MVHRDRVTIDVTGGPQIAVPWQQGMSVRAALETAFDLEDDSRFTYGLQYYGKDLGYLVMMINENYDSFDVRYEPDFYWEMLVNGSPAGTGIDGTILEAGDVVTFRYEMRRPGQTASRLTDAKHARRELRPR